MNRQFGLYPKHAHDASSTSLRTLRTDPKSDTFTLRLPPASTLFRHSGTGNPLVCNAVLLCPPPPGPFLHHGASRVPVITLLFRHKSHFAHAHALIALSLLPLRRNEGRSQNAVRVAHLHPNRTVLQQPASTHRGVQLCLTFPLDERGRASPLGGREAAAGCDWSMIEGGCEDASIIAIIVVMLLRGGSGGRAPTH
ncbi:unnamed protein product [Pleuronectes platessa]|uniref:Uncharacterized protein n=1 Tax=Pleuronectes platessa TaxID=8262 RepID=A0A9N7URD9_PLEPL|nr:unnamed protein product [Pleuronectes platessa]